MASDATADLSANPEQAEYWNSLIGPKWVLLQAEIDQRLQPLNAILTERAGIAAGHRVIDVGCGTGDLALHLAEVVGPGGAVLGADLSAPMLALAERRRAERGYGHLRFLQIDAQTHAFEPAAYDLALSRFGVMFFGDPAAAFANLRRALRPGGRVAFVCWQRLADKPWMAVPLGALARHLALPAPPPPGAPGPFAFADRARVQGLLESGGFAAVEVHDVREPLRLGGGSLDEAVEFALEIGPAASALREAGAGPELRARVADAVREALAPFAAGGTPSLPSAAWIFTARTGDGVN